MKFSLNNGRKRLRRGLIPVLVLVIISCLFLTVCSASETQEPGSALESFEFTSWNDDAPALEVLKEYVQDVTDETSEHFIPVEDRIAVFDMDGTLYRERAPTYVEYCMYVYRVNKDSSFVPDQDEKAVADQIIEFVMTGIFPSKLGENFAIQAARAYAGMTVEGYRQYVREFCKNPVIGFDGMTYKEAFFLPMKEVVEYLNENDFLCTSAAEQIASCVENW